MRTNLLNGLSNVVKTGASLACSLSQVGRMSGEGTIEHPLITHSAPFGIRWKPAGEKGSTRVWKQVAMIFAVLVMSIANIGMAWGTTTQIFNMTTVSSHDDVNVARKGGTFDLTVAGGYLSSLTGGSVTLANYNTSSGTSKMMGTDSKRFQIYLGENTNAVILTLDNALAEGDVISFTSSKSNQISFGLNSTRVTSPATTSNSYTIPAKSTLIGESTIYIWRSGGSGVYIETLTIAREDAGGGGGGGCTSHSVNLSSSGSVTGGTFATSSATVCEGETATLTATPAAGYEFTSWSATGTGGHSLSSTTTNPATLTMGTADMTVNATFSQIDYTISKTLTNCAVKAGSSAIPSTMHYGDDLSTIIEPTTGNLLPGSITVSGVTSYTWNALTGALTLTDVTGAVSISISAAAPQTGTSKTITYTMIKTNGTTASYSSSTFTNVLSGGASAANTIVASNIMKGGNGVGVQSDKSTANGTYTAGITTSTSDFAVGSTPYVEFRFDVVDGYTFTPTGISVPVQPISKNAYFKILVTDGSSTWATTSSECTSGSLTTITTAPTGGSALTGTVYVRVYCYSQVDAVKGYRFGTPITVTGTVAEEVSCTAPTAVYVTQTAGSSDMVAGESFTLSAATSTGVEDGATYQWYRNSTEVGTNSPTYTVPSCTKVDAGTYWCKITNPCGESTTNSTGYGIKVWQVLLYESSTWNSYDLTSTGTKTGELVHQLTPGTYYIKLTHNNGVDFGVNTGSTISEITATTPSPWTLYNGQNNIRLVVSNAGDYTFDVNFTSADNPTLSVTYPPSTISGCDKIYFCPTVNSIATGSARFSIYFWNATESGWANCYLVSGTDFADDAKYVAYAPATTNGWTKMIVVRDDEYASSFDGIWNQSQDITYNGYNYIVGTGWSDGKFTNNLNSFYSSTTPAMSAASYATTVGETTNASTNLTGATITYASDNTSIATINSSGVITGVAAGETTITASVGSCTVGSATVTISKNTPTQYTVSGTTSICSGDNTNITLSGSQTGASYQLKKGGVNEGEPKAGTGSSLTWSVSAAGTYTVSAVETAKYAARDMTGNAVITVKTPVTISWNTAPANGTVGGSMTASVTTNYSDGVAYSVQSATPAGCVTINSSTGAISYVAVGTATIRATVTGAGDYCSSAYVDQAVTVTAAAVLTALEADVLYQAADMANITFTGSDQYWAGLSTNNLFQTYGNGTSNSAKGKTISSTSVTDDISTKSFTSHAYIEGSDVTSGTADPTYGAIEFITPSTAGLLYVYTVDGSSSNLKLRKKGSSTFTALAGASNYKAVAVDASSNYYIHGNAGKRGLYGIQYVSTYAVTITPTNVTKATGDGTAIKGKAYTATFTANTDYALPDDATVTIGGVEQTKGTGYTWTISAGTATLTVPAAKVTGAISIAVSGVALPTHTVSYNGNGSTSGDAPTDANAYVEGADVTVLGKNTLVKTNNGFAGWNTATDGSGTWRVQGETFSMGAADVALYAQWVPTANLTVGTLYKAGEMKAKVIGSSTGYRPGYSSNGIFELLGVGTADDNDLKNTPMQYTTDGQTIDGTEFTHKLDFRGQGAGSPSGTTLPTARAIKFHVGESGTLHLWVRAGSKINIVKDGSSASAVGSSTDRTHETVEVTAGTWYLYATGTSTSLYGMKLVTCTDPELAYGTTAVEKNVGDAAFTNALTNPNSLSVSYSSSVTSVATVNATSGMVTIVGAGSTVITATWVGDATYCSGTATYTLTVSSGCTPQSLVKTQLTSVNAGTTTGYNGGQYAGDPVIATFEDTKVDGGYKLKSNSKLFVTLKGGFVEGDKINIVVTKASDLTNEGKLLIFYDASTPKLLTTIDAASAGTYTYTLTAANITTLGSTTTIGVYRPSSGDNVSNPLVKSVEVEGCREWDVCTAPDVVAAGSVTGEGATFTITDAENTNNYEIYYSTSSTAPTAETSATISGISTKSRAVTGLTAETTYYYWVRSNCGGATKSSWVAGTPASFTTEAAAATHNVTYNGNGKTGGSVPTDDTDYEEGDVVTVLGNTGSLVKAGQTFLGWSTNSTASSGTFFPAGYKFYMPNEAVTLYAVWGSTGCETLVNVAANSSTTVSATVGSATVNNPSSQGYAGAIKLNSGGYIELTPKAGSSFAAGNKITITMYCGADASKTIGFRLANKDDGNSMSASVAKRTEKTFEYTLVSGDITSGKVRIYRYGSESWFVSAIVEDCTGGGATGYTVTFNMNGKGSAISPIANVPDGSKIGAPVPAPTAVGAEFGGWYKEAGCSNAWNFATGTITADKTLYAKWTTCAPTISDQPSGDTYTQGAAATALSVTASGEGLNYQWYTSEEAGADIQGSSAIPGATSASYTPSTSLLGTIYYFCVVSNTCGNAVSNKAAITVNDSKPAPTANWDIEEPKEGGKDFTFSIEVNKNDGDNWDGELIASMLTLSDNAILDGASIVVDNTNKTISGTYGVKAGSSSPVTFYLLLPATATQSATRLDRDRTFTPCAGGAGDSYNVPVRKDYEKDASNNYRWVTPGAGEITYAVSSSISSAKAASTVASVFDSIMSGDKQYVWVKTYEANTKTIRLYVETSGANVSVSALYKNTVYTAAADKDIVSSDDYTVSYDGSGTAENTGVKGTHYMDITFDSPLDANDIICIKFSSSKVKAYGAVLTTVGDGGDQTTGLTWSNSQASGATVEKQEDAADFTITAVRDATALKSLGLISYTSSNTAIATIDGATGLVHIADNIDFGSDEFKTTTITATLAASGCYKKAVITYILKVIKHVCPDAPGTITYVDRGCSGMDLTLEGYEEGATIQWYKNGATISGATSATYNATEPGEYYAVTHKTCDITSTNSVTLEAATATAEKIVDQWYVKNGRRTPDIALVQTTGATSFTVTSGGTPVGNIGGCTFELKKDGIIYLHGQTEDGSAPSDMTTGDMTITITVSGCAGALSGLNITIHKQAETTKPSVAFVVDGTLRKDGGTATSVSEAKTSDRPLWTYLSSSYALTGCNVYWSVDSKELREYYSQYDAILITDDPSTYTKGAGGVEYVKAFGTMVDVRPILTMEAYVGRYSDGGWHVYKADPTSPNPRQVEMKLECKNHDIFKGLDPNASDNVRTTTDEHGNEYWHVIMVDTTVAPYHNTSKDYKTLPALQGFDPHKFDHMLGVGTIAEETLQGGVERQEEPAARMMILGIQNEAMAALTNEGKLIIKNAIEYLLKTNMEDVNDCSNYFTGGPSGTGDNWATPENWSSGKVPDFESRVRILRPVVISGDTKAIVARVDIATSGKSKWVDGECNGKVTVNSQGALIVGGKIRRAKAPYFGIDNLEPTENDDLIVKASTTAPHNQGALIFDNSDGDTHAEVEMWNPSHWEVDGGKKKKYWSYVAVPIQEADIPNFFWYGFTYLYDETSGWIKKSDGTSLYPFQGIGASLQEGNMEIFYGPLATTESQDITLTYTADKGQGMNLIGNSWTAPIQIANFEEDDFGDAAAEVWVFNTGNTNDGHTTMADGSAGTTTAGQWQTIPIGVAGLPGYTGLKVIPAMQAFEVNTGSETTLHLDYDRLVRAGRENLNEPMRAPRRSAAKQLEGTLRVRVSGEVTHTDVYLLKDARFSDAFDNGWDGHYLFGDDRSASLYAVSETEGAMAFLAQPEIDGTILGFAPSRYGNDYTFTFYYLGEEEYYLNDIKLQKSTLISEEESYMFTFEEGDTNRFYISKTPFEAPSVATGTENTGDGVKARKVLVNDKLYIILNGRVYSAEGVMVK